MRADILTAGACCCCCCCRSVSASAFDNKAGMSVVSFIVETLCAAAITLSLLDVDACTAEASLAVVFAGELACAAADVAVPFTLALVVVVVVFATPSVPFVLPLTMLSLNASLCFARCSLRVSCFRW